MTFDQFKYGTRFFYGRVFYRCYGVLPGVVVGIGEKDWGADDQLDAGGVECFSGREIEDAQLADDVPATPLDMEQQMREIREILNQLRGHVLTHWQPRTVSGSGQPVQSTGGQTS